MVGTILPMVHGEREHGRPRRILLLHSIGYLFGSTLMGGALTVVGKAALSNVQPTSRGLTALVVTGSLALLYSTREMGLTKLPKPQCRSQVPRRWCYLLPHKLTAFLYGTGLGFALLTRVPVSSFYAVALWVILVGEPSLGVICMALFGAGRALPVILLATREAGPLPIYFNRVLLKWKPVVHLVNGLALGSIGSVLLVAGFVLYA